MTEFKEYSLGSVCSRLSSGKGIPASQVFDSGAYPVYGGNGLRGFTDHSNFDGECAIIGRQGAFCGNVRYFSGEAYMTEHAVVTCANKHHSTRYLAYLLSTMNLGRLSGQSAQPGLSVKTLSLQTVKLPSKETQDKIVSVLAALDEKIVANEKINENLLQQAQTIYREMFVNTANDRRQTCRAEEYFDIAIGKTPPRKEHQWFTTDPSDVTWVSISDMGNCGTYIRKSSEQLTQEAIDKFNIRVIPSNTVLLSFKLTVGRIAITYGEMTTNEAIAHFKTDKPFINEYLYCYLKDFNYQTMGSTSSIATAVNSKIIKAMPFVIPTDDEISRFHAVVGPMFEQILNNQLENDSFAEMRDTLLPRLMSGELDVSDLYL